MSQENVSNGDFWGQVAALVFERQAMVLECVDCAACGKRSLAAHNWSEIVKCQHCGVTKPSIVPRLPVRGEVTLEHVLSAIATLKNTYTHGPLGQWSSETEWASLDDKTKLLITTNVSAAAVAVLKQVESLAEGLAKMAAELRDG